jgi:hypothetical protein
LKEIELKEMLKGSEKSLSTLGTLQSKLMNILRKNQKLKEQICKKQLLVYSLKILTSTLFQKH